MNFSVERVQSVKMTFFGLFPGFLILVLVLKASKVDKRRRKEMGSIIHRRERQ